MKRNTSWYQYPDKTLLYITLDDKISKKEVI